MSNPQDWEPVILRKPKSAEELKKDGLKNGTMEIVRKQTSTNKKTNQVAPKMANDFDPEHISAPKHSTLDLACAIRNARVAKEMKQADLDRVCNFPPNTVQQYENGTAIINSQQLIKLDRALGLTLPRPKK
jgi:putative transcription factor